MKYLHVYLGVSNLNSNYAIIGQDNLFRDSCHNANQTKNHQKCFILAFVFVLGPVRWNE